jgi:hypothetical protein
MPFLWNKHGQPTNRSMVGAVNWWYALSMEGMLLIYNICCNRSEHSIGLFLAAERWSSLWTGWSCGPDCSTCDLLECGTPIQFASSRMLSVGSPACYTTGRRLEFGITVWSRIVNCCPGYTSKAVTYLHSLGSGAQSTKVGQNTSRMQRNRQRIKHLGSPTIHLWQVQHGWGQRLLSKRSFKRWIRLLHW